MKYITDNLFKLNVYYYLIINILPYNLIFQTENFSLTPYKRYIFLTVNVAIMQLLIFYEIEIFISINVNIMMNKYNILMFEFANNM